MNKHYPFHTSVLDNFYGCDPYNTVDAQRLRRHVRTLHGRTGRTAIYMQPSMQGSDKYSAHTLCTWNKTRYMK